MHCQFTENHAVSITSRIYIFCNRKNNVIIREGNKKVSYLFSVYNQKVDIIDRFICNKEPFVIYNYILSYLLFFKLRVVDTR